MSEANLKVQIPDDVIKSAVFGEIARRLGDPAEVVSKMVSEVLMRPVEKEQYSREKVPLWEKLLKNQVEKFARVVVSELLEERKPEIRAAIGRKLQGKTFAGKLADALVASIDTSKYTVHLSLKAPD